MSAPALLVNVVQKAVDDPSWGDDRNNPDAEENIALMLRTWRARKWPIVHVRHLSPEPDSTYRPGQEGCEFKPHATGADDGSSGGSRFHPDGGERGCGGRSAAAPGDGSDRWRVDKHAFDVAGFASAL